MAIFLKVTSEKESWEIISAWWLTQKLLGRMNTGSSFYHKLPSSKTNRPIYSQQRSQKLQA